MTDETAHDSYFKDDLFEKTLLFLCIVNDPGCKHHLSERQIIVTSFLVSLSLFLYCFFHFQSIKNNHINKRWSRGLRPEKKGGRDES